MRAEPGLARLGLCSNQKLIIKSICAACNRVANFVAVTDAESIDSFRLRWKEEVVFQCVYALKDIGVKPLLFVVVEMNEFVSCIIL